MNISDTRYADLPSSDCHLFIVNPRWYAVHALSIASLLRLLGPEKSCQSNVQKRAFLPALCSANSQGSNERNAFTMAVVGESFLLRTYVMDHLHSCSFLSVEQINNAQFIADTFLATAS